MHPFERLLAEDTKRQTLRRAVSRYEDCHPDDTFADLANRARFSKEDRGLLRDWLNAVRPGQGSDRRAGGS